LTTFITIVYSNIKYWQSWSQIDSRAKFIEGFSTAAEESSIRVAAEGFISVEIFALIVDSCPWSVACTVVERKLQAFDSISLEVSIIPEPSLDLLTEVISNGLRSTGVD